MHSKTNTPRFLNTKAVSPIIGSILMVALVVIFTTMISGVILSQYNQPENPPTADVRFEQQAHSNIDQTSNLKLTLIEEYNSVRVQVIAKNNSFNLYQKDGTPYIAYKTDNTTACANAGKRQYENDNGIMVDKSHCILTPDDPSYTERGANMHTSGDQLFICHVPDKAEFSIVAYNSNGQQLVTTTYTTRYIKDYSTFQIKPRYNNPCA